MNAYITDYIDSLNVAKGIKERIIEIIDFYEEILEINIEKIFITDYIQEDGTRIFENLFLINETLIMEAKQFLHKDDFDCFKYYNNITSWQIEKTNYDFIKANEKSRLSIICRFENVSAYFQMKASKNNCDYLKELFINDFKPNRI